MKEKIIIDEIYIKMRVFILRKQLHKLLDNNSMTSKVVLKKSQELDKYVLMVTKLHI